ncbi:MAG: hypothetical protein IKW79_04270 [Schwartzia sp.]|nr:hypothetical protein [Schwartzia sp. (in: firmicutes)]
MKKHKWFVVPALAMAVSLLPTPAHAKIEHMGGGQFTFETLTAPPLLSLNVPQENCGLFDGVLGSIQGEVEGAITDAIRDGIKGGKENKSNAQKMKIVQEFFPRGELSPQRKPHLRYGGHADNGDRIRLWYNLPKEFIALAGAYQQSQEKGESMQSRFGVEDYQLYLQTDVSIDNGPWQYTSAWDNPDWNGPDAPYYLAFQCNTSVNNHDQAFYQNFELSWLTYLENGSAGFLSPIVGKDGNNYHYDLSNHTLGVRTRLVLKYKENGKEKCLFSAWSPETSIGKDGNQTPLAAPAEIATPSVSEFKADGHYFLNVSDSVFDGLLYCEAEADMFEPYVIESQVRKGDGEWMDVYTANPPWIFSGYRLASLNDVGSVDEIRVRIVCRNLDLASEWSEVARMAGK